MTQRVVAIGIYHDPGHTAATGINLDTLQGVMTLSRADDIFPGHSGSGGKNAIHVGIDAAKTTVNGTSSAQVTSVPFPYGSGQARAVVDVTANPPGGGFKVVNEADGATLVTSGPQPFAAGNANVQITPAAA